MVNLSDFESYCAHRVLATVFFFCLEGSTLYSAPGFHKCGAGSSSTPVGTEFISWYSARSICRHTGESSFLFCFYGMFSHLLALQWCSLLQKRLLFQQNLEWVVLKIPKLRWLASFLPAVLVQDRATSTAANYLPAYKSWKTWAKKHSASYLPADSVVSTLYIVSPI